MIDEILVPDTVTIIAVALTSLLIAGVAYYKKVLDQGGSALAFLICFVSGTLGHWSWLLLLLIFVVCLLEQDIFHHIFQSQVLLIVHKIYMHPCFLCLP